MAKILLVKPDASFALDVAPPVGLGYLGASIRQAGHEVRVLDNRLRHQGEEVFFGTLDEWQPDVVGFSAFSYEVGAVHRLAGEVRRKAPGTPILVGGPLASADPEGSLGRWHRRLRGSGRGRAGSRRHPRSARKGRRHRRPAGYRLLGQRQGRRQPDQALIPISTHCPTRLGLARRTAYWRLPRQGFIYKHRNYFPVFTSRGCPYRCIYCHDVFGKKFRPRSTETVLNEIGELVDDYGCKEIHFVDDIFNLEPDRAAEILQGIIDNGWDLALSYPNGLRGDILSEELVDLMKAAGTFKASIAIESGTKRMQKSCARTSSSRRPRKHPHARRAADPDPRFLPRRLPQRDRGRGPGDDRLLQGDRGSHGILLHRQPVQGHRAGGHRRGDGQDATADYRVSGYFDPTVADSAISEVAPDRCARWSAKRHADFYMKNPRRMAASSATCRARAAAVPRLPVGQPRLHAEGDQVRAHDVPLPRHVLAEPPAPHGVEVRVAAS